jgi:hypothetical protein
MDGKGRRLKRNREAETEEKRSSLEKKTGMKPPWGERKRGNRENWREED